MDDWLPQLLQGSDAIFPTGSYAHSFGLEGIVQRGLVQDEESLRIFLKQVIAPALAHIELPFVFQAHQTTDVAKLCALDELAGALKGARELRDASRSIGAQRLQLLAQLAPHPLLDALEARRQAGEFSGHGPIVFGIQMALAQTPAPAALAAYYYQGLAAMVSAALKLIRIGQTGCQRLLTELLRETPAAIATAMALTIDEIGWFCPTLDIASAEHETAYNRLFIS